MSWEKKQDGRYLVRWRDSAGRSRSKTVYRQRDAIALDGEMKRKRSMGELLVHERGTETLAEFWQLWQHQYAATHVSPRTLAIYRRHWDKHVDPVLGTRKLRDITPERIERLVAALNARCAPATTRKVMAIMQGVLQRAVDWGYLPANPARGVRRPRLVSRRGRALTTRQLDAICAELTLRGATVTRVLAWTGLRPGELRALTWERIGANSIWVRAAVSGDEMRSTKTGAERDVELQPAARRALLEWYVAQGQPSEGSLIFPGRDGRLWRDEAYNRWQQTAWKPAAERAGVKGAVLYDLRHTYASWLIDQGRSPAEVAGQLGHSVAQCLATYTHVFEDRRKSVASPCHANASMLEILSNHGRSAASS